MKWHKYLGGDSGDDDNDGNDDGGTNTRLHSLPFGVEHLTKSDTKKKGVHFITLYLLCYGVDKIQKYPPNIFIIIFFFFGFVMRACYRTARRKCNCTSAILFEIKFQFPNSKHYSVASIF